MNEIRIENWAIVYNEDAYTAPELRVPRLRGNVFGHPRIEDGKPIITSRVLETDLKGGVNGIAITRNTVYRLGTPNADYAAQYPDSFPK